MRTKSERIHFTNKHIKRKLRIMQHWETPEEVKWFLNNPDKVHGNLRAILGERNRLSKAKIHCSCHMCSYKTKTHGWKHSDLRKIEAGDYYETD